MQGEFISTILFNLLWITLRFFFKNSQCTPYNILSLNLFSSMHDYHMESILGDCKNIWMHKLTKMSDLKKKRGLYQFIVDLDLINNFSKLCNYKCKMLKDMLRTLFKKSNIVTCIWIQIKALLLIMALIFLQTYLWWKNDELIYYIRNSHWCN